MAVRLETQDDHLNELGRISDGRIGYGPSDYLDQTVDGRPVRVDE
jgi:hypothetical protein